MAEVSATAAVEGRSSSQALLNLSRVDKVYGKKGVVTKALSDISFAVDEGEFVAIMGPSGSGKTTLLNCIATIDDATSGSIVLEGRDITRLRGGKLADFRRNELGFVFQDSNLIETLTGFENIALALTLKKVKPSEVEPAVQEVARALGVEGVLKKFPNQMSGGQRQRVAAARAIVAHPKLILADEPTGALDSRNTAVMLETLTKMNGEMHATIMMVTHDSFAASFSSRVIFIKDGIVFNEVRRGSMERSEYRNRILEVIAFLGGEETSHAR